MIPIQAVNDVDLAYGGVMKKLLPEAKAIPKEFWDHDNPLAELVAQWFFRGLDGSTDFISKEGVDAAKAMRHIAAIMRSWEPSHEHKTAGCAYLLAEWLEDVRKDNESLVGKEKA